MAISINWGTKVVYVPKADLIPLGGNVYKLDLDVFRLALKDLEDSEEGMCFPDTHRHNTEVVLSGVTYSRFIEITNGYTVTFEDGQYAVNAVGANSNIADVMNVNQVSLRTSNSAGLITVTSGSGVTEQDKLDIVDGVWEAHVDDYQVPGSMADTLVDINTKQQDTLDVIMEAVGTSQSTIFGDLGIIDDKVDQLASDLATVKANVAVIEQIEKGKWDIVNGVMTLYAANGTTPIVRFRLYDKDNALVTTTTQVPVKRVPF